MEVERVDLTLVPDVWTHWFVITGALNWDGGYLSWVGCQSGLLITLHSTWISEMWNDLRSLIFSSDMRPLVLQIKSVTIVVIAVYRWAIPEQKILQQESAKAGEATKSMLVLCGVRSTDT